MAAASGEHVPARGRRRPRWRGFAARGRARVDFLEETLRDGQLSMWATRMPTDAMLGAAGMIERGGFARACVTSGAAFDTAIRHLREDPWERLDLLRAAMPGMPLSFLVRGRNVIGWQRYPDDVVELMIRAIRDTGFDWILLFDGLNDMQNIECHVRVAKDVGLRVGGIVFYTVSPVHTDAYFLEKVRELVRLGVDAINLYDASGVLRPERAARLVQGIRREIGDIDLELNVHDTTGLAEECYLAGLEAGANILSTAARPLAWGGSVPDTATMMARAVGRGYEVPLDEGMVAALDEYFTWIACRDEQPSGRHRPFDEDTYNAYVAHQVPGAMMSNFSRQLADAGLQHKLPEVLEEVAEVRRELGYPPMVTPYSQMTGVQATLNVIEGERYRTVPQEVERYVQGYYGTIPGEVDPDVRDRVCGDADEAVDLEALDARRMVERVRRERGPFESGRELALATFYDAETLDALRREQHRVALADVPRSPLSALIKALGASGSVRRVRVEVGAGSGEDTDRPEHVPFGYAQAGEVIRIANNSRSLRSVRVDGADLRAEIDRREPGR